MSERAQAIALANRILDRPSGDPDDDLGVLARQLLRATETGRPDLLSADGRALLQEWSSYGAEVGLMSALMRRTYDYLDAPVVEPNSVEF